MFERVPRVLVAAGWVLPDDVDCQLVDDDDSRSVSFLSAKGFRAGSARLGPVLPVR
jgi:hypothetical protein